MVHEMTYYVTGGALNLLTVAYAVVISTGVSRSLSFGARQEYRRRPVKYDLGFNYTAVSIDAFSYLSTGK